MPRPSTTVTASTTSAPPSRFGCPPPTPPECVSTPASPSLFAGGVWAAFAAASKQGDDDGRSGAPASFRALEARVAAGTLRVTFVGGVARGGTTASEKVFYESLGFDGNFNQPHLLAREGEGATATDADVAPDRVVRVWDRVLSKVEALERAKASTPPTSDDDDEEGGESKGEEGADGVTLVIKETLNCVVGPGETRLLRRLAPATVVVVRDPWLQLESRVGCVLGRVDDGALAPFGLDPVAIDPATFCVAGFPLVAPGTDLSHLDRTEGGIAAEPLWAQHVRHMRETRDYSSLGDGFVRLSSMHPMFEVPACQRHVWAEHARRNPGSISDDDVKVWLGTRLEGFHALPMNLARAFFEWDMSWVPVRDFLDTSDDGTPDAEEAAAAAVVGGGGVGGVGGGVGRVGGGDGADGGAVDGVNVNNKRSVGRGGGRLVVVDFHDLQTSAQGKAVALIADRIKCVTSPSQVGNYDFDVCSGGAEWDRWFLKSCDWDVLSAHSAERTVLKPPRRGPLPPDRFPACLRSHFAEVALVYMRCVQSSDYVDVSGHAASVELDAQPADPVHAYARAKTGERRAALRAHAPGLSTYFDLLDQGIRN